MTPPDPNCVFAVTRRYKATKNQLLKAWSTPEIITNWWGPYGFRTTTHKMDFRPGGEWRFTMHEANGTDYPNYVQYIQTGPDVIEYDHGTPDEPKWFHVHVALNELGPKETEMVFTMIFPSPEVKEALTRGGAEQGLYHTTSRLAIWTESLPFESDEDAVRRVLSDWASATSRGAKDEILKNHSEALVIYDVLEPMRYMNRAVYQAGWDEWQPEVEGAMTFNLKDLELRVDDKLGFAYGLLECGGTTDEGTEFSDLVRITFCLAKGDDGWKVVHQHVSKPH